MSSGLGGRLRLGAALTVCALLPVLAVASIAQAQPQGANGSARIDAKPEKSKVPPGHSRTRLHLKFVDGTAIRLRGNRFSSLGSADVRAVNAVLTRSGARAQRLFERSEQELALEKARNEARSPRKQPDKNLWYRLVLRDGDATEAVLDELNALSIVETAYAEPLPSPPPVTPSFVADQGYREAATDGIDADFASAFPGGTGANVSVIDIEYSWNQAHEDLGVIASSLIPNKTPADPFSDNNHGTAVIGEIAGDSNAFGVTGIAHDAAVSLVNANNSEDGYDLADSIDLAASSLGAGDVIIIEQQTAGANGGCGMSQVGCVAVEWVQAYYDAIVSATSAGIIVLEAAGNGSEDLGDTGDYGDPFPDDRADSGAIIVGAGGAPGCTPPARGRLGFSTFGPRVNLQGWGQCVVTSGYGDLQGSSMSNDAYTSSFGGTSSATPIVTGAAAIVSSMAQQQGVPMTPAQVRALLMATGTAQATGGGANAGNIGPLPNLRAALESAFLPTADAGGPYATDEGTDVTVSASGSTDPQGSALTYAWDLDDDGQFDDASGVSATFTRVGRDGAFTIAVRATDPAGAFDDDEATVNVANVAPTATIDAIASQPENTAVSLSGVVSDPGWEDPLSGSVSWGDGSVEPLSGVLENARPDATLAYSGSHVYGDNGTFTVQVCPADDDTIGVCVSTMATVGNVSPTAQIDETGTTLVNGVPTFIASIGVPVPFSGGSLDPGSDDLTLSWNWDDGPPAPDESTLYLVNPPGADGLPSPSVQPRNVTDSRSHTFTDACLYTVLFASGDDDGGGGASDSVQVIIGGLATTAREAGYWQTQYQPRPTALDGAVLQCYLEIAGFMSAVFDEARDASTMANAYDVLHMSGNEGSELQKLDRQLLIAWLNFANGAFLYGQLLDADGDGTAETPFAAVLAAAEAVRLNPAATEEQLRDQRQLLNRLTS